MAGTVTQFFRGLKGRQPELVHSDVSYEDSDIRYNNVLLAGVALVAGMWLCIALLLFCFHILKGHRDRVSPLPLPAEQHGIPLPPEPRLQQSPRQDLEAYRAKQDWELTHYSWLNRKNGRVVIPISEAIRILAQQGIKPTSLPPNPTQTPPAAGTRLTGFEGKVEPEPR